MQRHCDVCANFRPQLGGTALEGGITEVTFGKRSVSLCRLHARLLDWAKVTTFEGVRKAFSESTGKRSFIPRRAAPRAVEGVEGRPARGAGRRLTDSLCG